jgi:hypothetical protein
LHRHSLERLNFDWCRALPILSAAFCYATAQWGIHDGSFRFRILHAQTTECGLIRLYDLTKLKIISGQVYAAAAATRINVANHHHHQHEGSESARYHHDPHAFYMPGVLTTFTAALCVVFVREPVRGGTEQAL